MNEFPADEPPEARAFDYDRTVALSDGVFAIALTLLVLNLTVPSLGPGHRGELGSRLLDRGTEFYTYALSFAVISVYWVRHHALFRAINKIDMKLTLMNLAYLAFIAFLPYPTRVLGIYGHETAAVVLYAATGGILTTIGVLTRVYALRAQLLSDVGARLVARREHWAIAPAVWVTSIPIAFASPRVAELWWLLFLVPGFRRRLG